MIGVVPSNKQGVIISGTFFYSKLANYQNFMCKVEILKPAGVLKFLRNQDSVNDFNENESVWIFSHEDEPDLEPLLLQQNDFGGNA